MKRLIKPRLVAIACCIAILAMLTCALGVHFSPDVANREGAPSIGVDQLMLTIGHIDHVCATAVHFLADGVDDHSQFQQALDALPAEGGKIIVLAGTYNFGNVVSRPIDNVTIQGLGTATVVNRDGINPVFSAGAQSNWVFRDFKTDAGGIEVATATNWMKQNITIGTDYVAYKPDAPAADWEIPVGRTATIVVAASISSPQSKAQADFVADGVDDHLTIQAAIDALPAGGGKVLLMEGTYHMGLRAKGLDGLRPSSIVLNRPNITLSGVGSNTILRLKDAAGTLSAGHIELISILGTSCTLRDLKIDGNKANNLDLIYGAAIPEVGLICVAVGSNHNTISNLQLVNLPAHGIAVIGSYNLVTNNRVSGTEGADNFATDPPAHNNIFSNNISSGAIKGDGFDIGGSYHTVVGNVSLGDEYIGIHLWGTGHTVQGNTIIESTYIAILIGGSSITVIGNTIGRALRMSFHLNRAEHSVIIGNIIHEPRPDQQTIQVTNSHYNLIQSNKIIPGDAGNPVMSIFLDAATTNQVIRGNHLPISPWGVYRGIFYTLRDDGKHNIWFEPAVDNFTNVLGASTTHIHPAITPDGATHTDVTSPDVPRTTMIRITNTDTVNAQTPSGGNIVIHGTDARGRPASETLVVPATSIPAGGTSDVFGSVPFLLVSSVDYYTETNTRITVSVGTSNKLGLRNVIYTAADVTAVKRGTAIVATEAVDVVNGTVDVGPITAGEDFTIHYRSNLNILR